MTALITFAILAILSLGWLGFTLLLKQLGKNDTHFTELTKETGKGVVKGKNVVNLLFNSKNGFYDKEGNWKECKDNEGNFICRPQNLGSLFEKLGITFFGLSPINEILKFKVYQNDEQFEEHTSFKHLYDFRIIVKEVELLGGEIKIDLDLKFRFKVMNITKLLFLSQPDGITIYKASADIETAVNNFVRNKEWDAFEKADKTSKDSDFIRQITESINETTLRTLGIEVDSMKLANYGISKGPSNEEVDKSLSENLIAENEGKALITRSETAAKVLEIKTNSEGKALIDSAKFAKDAHILTTEAEAHRFGEMSKVAKKNPGIIPFMNLEQVKETQIRVLGANVISTINVDGDETKKEGK
ncbi:MAG: hypothetical protein WAV23_01745 [Minisyncoccia bacterium]